jgi:hypothetical protein
VETWQSAGALSALRKFEKPARGIIEKECQKTGKGVLRERVPPKWPLVKLGRSGGVFSGKAMV